MFKQFIATILFALSAQANHGPKHHAHAAHVHGHGEIEIAFENTVGTVEIHAPSESIYGFEHAAKKSADRAAVEEAFKKLESRIGDIVVFDASLGCRWSKTSIETQRETRKHSEVRASFKVSCEKSPKGGTIRFAPATVFPKLKDVDVTVLIDDLQKSIEVEAAGAELKLQ